MNIDVAWTVWEQFIVHFCSGVSVKGKGKVKGKGRPVTGHEGPELEKRYIGELFLYLRR
jgi:hypothetical protein